MIEYWFFEVQTWAFKVLVAVELYGFALKKKRQGEEPVLHLFEHSQHHFQTHFVSIVTHQQLQLVT